MKLKKLVFFNLIVVFSFCVFSQETIINNNKIAIHHSSNIVFFNTSQRESFNVKDIYLADFLRLISKTYNVNLLYENIKPMKITVALEKVNVNDLLNFLIIEYNLDYQKMGNIVKIFPASPPSNLLIKKKKQFLDITIQNVSLKSVLLKLSKQGICNVNCEKNIEDTKIILIAKDISCDSFLNLLATKYGFSLAKQKDFYFLTTNKNVPSLTPDYIFKINYDEQSKFIDIQAKNMGVQVLLSHLMTTVKKSYVFVEPVKARVNVNLKSNNLESLLDSICESAHVGWYQKDNVYYFGPDTSSKMTYSDLIKLFHLNVESVFNYIPSGLKKNLTIKKVPEQNALLVRGNPYNIRLLKDIVKQFDAPVAQVLIEVLVVDFKRTDLSEFGLNLKNGQNSFFPGVDVNIEVNRESGGWTIAKLPSNFLMTIHALAKQGVARIISKPHISTLNGKEASIVVGQKLFYKVKSEIMMGDLSPQTRTTEKIESIEANITLKIKPYVMPGGEVVVNIEPDFNTFLGDVVDNVPPPINYRRLKSTVRLKDGQTIILGGLIQEVVTRNYKGLPWISKLPLIGHLFKNHEKNKENSELVMYITPHIYYGNEGSAQIIKHDEGLSYNLDVETQGEKEQKIKRK